jgi:hypothetical protein
MCFIGVAERRSSLNRQTDTQTTSSYNMIKAIYDNFALWAFRCYNEE